MRDFIFLAPTYFYFHIWVALILRFVLPTQNLRQTFQSSDSFSDTNERDSIRLITAESTYPNPRHPRGVIIPRITQTIFDPATRTVSPNRISNEEKRTWVRRSVSDSTKGLWKHPWMIYLQRRDTRWYPWSNCALIKAGISRFSGPGRRTECNTVLVSRRQPRRWSTRTYDLLSLRLAENRARASNRAFACRLQQHGHIFKGLLLGINSWPEGEITIIG